MSREFLNDKGFLEKLYSLTVREEYLRITALDWNENPIRVIKGDFTSQSGTLNIDGNSSVRRTGSLSFVADPEENDLTGIDSLISINRKIKIERGIKNTVPSYTYKKTLPDGQIETITVDYQKEYGDICWFNEGIFVIFDPSVNNSTTGVDISFNFKDKMCLLNGDAGGTIPASMTLSEYEYVDEDGLIIIEKPTIYMIIQELVNHFGKEDLTRIIISDIDERIKMTMQYQGSDPLYFVNNNSELSYFLDYDEALVAAGYNENRVSIFESGTDVGYIMTDFVYPGELVADAGNTVCTVLDKIKEQLGNYEYFYDVEGNFIFREKKNYLNTTYTTEVLKNLNENADYSLDYSKGMSEWDFSGNKLVSGYSNNPQYGDIKNDYIIWGVRTGTTGLTFPIRYHLAIDSQPKIGQYHEVRYYEDDYGVTRAVAGSVQPDESSDINYTAVRAVYSKDYREELYYQGLESEVNGTDESYYWAELKEEFPKVFDLNTQKFEDVDGSGIDWWLDIIDDSDPSVGKYSVNNIGRRSKVDSKNDYNCVFEKEIPDVVIISTSDENIEAIRNECNVQGQAWVQVDDTIYSTLTGGGTLNSCYQQVVQNLYTSTTMNNVITITAIPMYHLEPNTRITVYDNVSDIHGDYIITSISCPLQQGEMNISACQAQQKM